MSISEQRAELVAVCHLLYQRGHVVSNDGNVSLRLDENHILITPSGVSKGRVTPEQLVVCDLEGRVVEGNRHPSSETPMHLVIYQNCPHVGAVVHAHPVWATAFAVCQRPLDTPYLTETVSGLGEIPLAPFALPSTPEVPDSIRPYLHNHRAALLANHGAIAWGRDLWQAFDRLESVEHTARIYAAVEQLGGGAPLTSEQVTALRGLESRYHTLAGFRAPSPTE